MCIYFARNAGLSNKFYESVPLLLISMVPHMEHTLQMAVIAEQPRIKYNHPPKDLFPGRQLIHLNG